MQVVTDAAGTMPREGVQEKRKPGQRVGMVNIQRECRGRGSAKEAKKVLLGSGKKPGEQ